MSVLRGSWGCPECGESTSVVAVRRMVEEQVVSFVDRPDGGFSELLDRDAVSSIKERYRCTHCLADFSAPVRRQRVWYA